MMEFSKDHFRGILSNIDISTINEDLINLLLKKNVIVDKTSQDTDWSGSPLRIKTAKILGFGPTGPTVENSEIFYFPLFFNNRRYELNELIIKDIYRILESFKERGSTQIDIEKLKIKQKTDSFLDHEKKVTFLKTLYEQRINEIPPQYYDDYLFYAIRTNVDGYEQWRKRIEAHIGGSIETQLFYLKNDFDDYCYFVSDNDPELFLSKKYEGKFPLIRNWRLFHKTKKLQDYVNEQLDKLQSPIQYQNRNRLTPFEQVCFVEKLRELGIKFKLFEYNKKLAYLNLITKGKNDDAKLQIENLEKIVVLDSIEYSKLHDNYSEFGRLLNMISGSSFDNLRMAVSDFNKESIKESFNIKLTLENMESLIKTIE